MDLLLIAILLGAGALLLVQGIKHSNRRRSIVGAAILTLTLGFLGLMSLREEIPWLESLGLEIQHWLNLSVRVGLAIAVGTLAVALGELSIWSLQNRLIRRFAIFTAALGGAWWWAQSWSEFLVLINRVATAIADTVFG